MTSTGTATTSAPPRDRSAVGRRVAAAASVVFGISMFWLVASVNVPHEATARKVTAFWRSSENLNGAMASTYFALLAAICLTIVVNHVRSLDVSAPTHGHVADFARSTGLLCAATLVVVGAMRGAIAHLVKLEDLPLPDPDVLRYATSLGYSLLGLGTMGLLGATILAISAQVLGGQILGRWVGILGGLCGLVILAAAVVGFGPFAIPVAILWAVALAVALLRGDPAEQ